MNSESYSTMIFRCFDDLNRCRNVRLEGDFIGDDAPFYDVPFINMRGMAENGWQVISMKTDWQRVYDFSK
jgi:hypothetical protein